MAPAAAAAVPGPVTRSHGLGMSRSGGSAQRQGRQSRQHRHACCDIMKRKHDSKTPACSSSLRHRRVGDRKRIRRALGRTLEAPRLVFAIAMALHFGRGQALFDTRLLWQTNPVAGESNTINIVLKSDTTLAAGTEITISGVSGVGAYSISGGTYIRSLSAVAGYPDTSLNFACGTTAVAAGGTACFSYETGTITFTLGKFWQHASLSRRF